MPVANGIIKVKFTHTSKLYQMSRLIAGFLCLFYLNGIAQASITSTQLPAALINGRFYIKIPTVSGDTILGFCNTGGGYNAIYPVSVSRLHLENKILETDINSGKIKYIPVRTS